jgi:hypothetical protein
MDQATRLARAQLPLGEPTYAAPQHTRHMGWMASRVRETRITNPFAVAPSPTPAGSAAQLVRRQSKPLYRTTAAMPDCRPADSRAHRRCASERASRHRSLRARRIEGQIRVSTGLSGRAATAWVSRRLQVRRGAGCGQISFAGSLHWLGTRVATGAYLDSSFERMASPVTRAVVRSTLGGELRQRAGRGWTTR